MKEKYLKPEMEVVLFDNKDVITTSGIEDQLPFVPAGTGTITDKFN